jgi:DNA-3-methyladenine glycosylase I
MMSGVCRPTTTENFSKCSSLKARRRGSPGAPSCTSAAYRRAFAGFDPRKVARFGAADVRRLLGDEGIVRNRLKVRAAIENARAMLLVQHERGSFDAYAWSFVGGKPLVNRPRSMADVPARTPESDAFSQSLRERGFRFVGSTIVYAFMQACGLVDDHVRGCFRAKRR